jgi:tRNA uridine 5-carboxymethylaminomethyl modification enzyme
LETKKLRGLFFAGQINGTSGYEEAAAQGLMAGINAARYCSNQIPLILDRSQAYIGVLIDDLVTCGTKEPYRLFTSRAEYRLLLREDNADARLTSIGYDIGLVPKSTYSVFQKKQGAIESGRTALESHYVKPAPAIDAKLATLTSSPIKQRCTLADLLRRPELTLDNLCTLPLDAPERETLAAIRTSNVQEEIQLQVKFQGYLARQEEQVARFKKIESVLLPEDIDYHALSGLSNEVVEKLTKIRPLSLGQASRISGITPAAISVLQVHLKKMPKQR